MYAFWLDADMLPLEKPLAIICISPMGTLYLPPLRGILFVVLAISSLVVLHRAATSLVITLTLMASYGFQPFSHYSFQLTSFYHFSYSFLHSYTIHSPMHPRVVENVVGISVLDWRHSSVLPLSLDA